MLNKIAEIKVTRLDGMASELAHESSGSTELMVKYLERMAETAPRLGASHRVKVEATSHLKKKYTFNFELQHPSVFDLRFELNSKLYSVMRAGSA